MRVKFLRAWRGIPQGIIRDWPDGAANLLISRKICEEHSEVQKPKQRKPRHKNGSRAIK